MRVNKGRSNAVEFNNQLHFGECVCVAFEGEADVSVEAAT